MRLEGWKITGLVSIVLAFVLIAVLTWHGTSEDGVRAVVRNSARSSVILFLLAFSASSLHCFFQKNWTAWLLRNRRYVGVSFTVSHFYHLLALVALAVWFPHPFLDKLNLISVLGGGLAYLFIAAMTATSFNSTRQWLGIKRWKQLHTIGSYYIWFIFAQSYFPLSIEEVFYVPFVVALVVVMLFRIFRVFQRHAPSDAKFGTEDT